MSRVVIAAIALGVLNSCCSYPSHAHIDADGHRVCAKHHIPLVTTHGFTYAGRTIILVHYKPYQEFEKIDACTPNRIDDGQSLKPRDEITKPSLITYCPLCEREFQERWYGPIITMAQLAGTWRNTRIGNTITIDVRGRCHGIGYDGKPFSGTWKIVRRGLIESQYRGDSWTEYHVVTRIGSDYFLNRSYERTDKYVRVL